VVEAAQDGTQTCSQNVPWPAAVETPHVAQVSFWTPRPSSAQASTMAVGRMLSRCGGALVQSAMTPG
jgi:hypothetical protein